ncbi:metallophosphoesterase family protein [Pseudomonas chlororaphis]|uniref:metallophosphoesterase family protein n=1 Tax=Pseudomonas chlororaphis TaxID=587753 RepID=UPI000D1106E9|nr:metallophosphoesterase family protein [Pseudomonas chlororaphis]AVO59277.1 YfcE family phosphodiesterase [Pseudomonas chlororaphis subsp. piscium]
MKIGLISDTHGLLRPDALAALQGCAHILHAGDIGDPQILAALGHLAPVTAVFGNVDQTHDWAHALPRHITLKLDGLDLLLCHVLAEVPKPLPPGVRVVVTGHSHQPRQFWQDDVLYINPGSAGPRRFKLPVSLGYLILDAGQVEGHLVELAV